MTSYLLGLVLSFRLSGTAFGWLAQGQCSCYCWQTRQLCFSKHSSCKNWSGNHILLKKLGHICTYYSISYLCTQHLMSFRLESDVNVEYLVLLLMQPLLSIVFLCRCMSCLDMIWCVLMYFVVEFANQRQISAFYMQKVNNSWRYLEHWTIQL